MKHLLAAALALLLSGCAKTEMDISEVNSTEECHRLVNDTLVVYCYKGHEFIRKSGGSKLIQHFGEGMKPVTCKCRLKEGK